MRPNSVSRARFSLPAQLGRMETNVITWFLISSLSTAKMAGRTLDRL